MKKLLIFITLAFTTISTYAQTDTKLDSLHTVINSEVNKTTRGLEDQITLINTELKANKEQQQQALKSLGDVTKSMIGDSIGAVRTQLSNLMEKEVSTLSSLIKAQNKEMAKLNGSIVTLKEQLDGNLTKMNSQLDSLDSGLGDANKQLETTQQSSELARQDIKDNVLYLLGAICIILILIIVVYWLTHKKHNTAQNEIADAKTHLEEQINTANADFAEKLLEAMNKLPKPGEGPNPEQRENGFYNLRFYSTLKNGSIALGKVTGDRDPGYGSTSKMIAESAICLAKDELSDIGGILTPASAMGDALLKRLQYNAGLTFSFEMIG